jgi:hypothetical protein
MPRDTYDMFSPPERGRFGENEQRQDRPDQYPAPGKAIGRGSHLGREIDLVLILHRETTGAVLVSQNGDESRGVWLPRSLIKIEMLGKPVKDRHGKAARACQVTLPEWKAKQAGLT